MRVLSRQTRSGVDLIPASTVRQGATAVSAALDSLNRKTVRYAVADAIEDDDLLVLGAACAEMKLVTGGSGMAIGLPENFRRAGLIPVRNVVEPLPPVGGLGAVIAGSASQATLGQVAAMRARHPSLALDPLKIAENASGEIEQALDFARANLA